MPWAKDERAEAERERRGIHLMVITLTLTLTLKLLSTAKKTGRCGRRWTGLS